MREALGWDVTAPKMSELGWSIASQTEVLTRHIDAGQYDLLVGSSMGGLAAANASSMRPKEEFRLLLIAPAFGLAENWEGMEETGRSAWKTTGERRYTGYELDIVLPWEFMESAEKMSWPRPVHNTAIMHGKFDEVVPISYSRKVVEDCENVILHETEDSHRMKDSLRLIPDIVSKLMGGSEILSTEMVDGAQSKPPNEEEKLEVPNEISPIVSETGEEGGTDPVEEKVVDSEEDIEQLEAEMRELEAKVAQKKAALKTSKEEARIEQLAVEKAKEEAEKERQSEDAEEAIKKAEEKVEVAKAEVEEAIKKAEKEEAEAEEARLIADLEEDEAKEAKEDAETAKRNLDEAVREAELAGMNVEQITEDAEKMKREMVIIERIRQRSDTIDWTHIGSAEGVKPDDLTRINGIDEFTQKKLNALGLVTFEQLSKIDANITETVNDALEFVPGRVAEMEWTKQAITMIGLEGVDSVSHKQGDLDETGIADLSAAKINWAQIGKAGDRKSDDLTKIKGIDLEIEKKLKVLGIRTFDQISKMDKDTSEAVNGALGLMSGRVTKMMWVQQAVALIE
tara:strand:+ start:1013 stop:2719 length:1707 start_codon:yes stop_codon:yes gene_type:complete